MQLREGNIDIIRFYEKTYLRMHAISSCNREVILALNINLSDDTCLLRYSFSGRLESANSPQTLDGRKTITFQQCSDHRVLIYIYNRLITLFTKGSVQLAVPVRQTKVHR